ncbi:MAG: hypothetical protein IJ363_10380 [Clostridia bacterium]|nr:hypothetical protein [Clostridia bacterium]
MKKCLAYLAILSLLLSLGTVFAAAELPSVSFTPGKFLADDPDAFSTVGTVTVDWKPDIASQIDMTDGDLSDWYAAGLTATEITSYNMVSWVRDEAVTDWRMTSFCAADPDYLYLAFDITDPDFAYGTGGDTYDGDVLQLSLDFGGKMGEVIEEDPDVLMGPKNIFYSFSCEADGAPIRVMQQESDMDGWLTEADGDGVKGAAKRTDKGWSVELALSWQRMYDDYVWKAWEDDAKIYASEGMEMPLRVGCALYYINRAESGGEVLWAAGVTKGLVDDDGNPVVSWTPYDNGITWSLPIQKDVSFTCPQIVIVEGLDTTAPPETEPPYDPPVDYPDTEEWVETELNTNVEWYDTIPPEVEETLRDAAEDLDAEDELNAILEKYGCTAAVGMGSLTVLLTVTAAAYVIRKRK